MIKNKYLIAVLAVLLFNGNAIAQFGSGLSVVVPDPSSNLVPPLSSASAIPLPELSAQDLALLERAAQANAQTATPFTSILDDGEEADTPQSNQGAVVAEVAKAPGFMQIISLVQDLVDARGSKETQGVIEDIKECLLEIIDDAEYVSMLAEICGELKDLPQEIVRHISGALGTRLRTAMESWKLTEENYSSFIDLAALFPEVATEARVAGLRTIIEEAIEKGDLTKLIIALTELSSLPEGLARMLLELSNRHADKFMAELKEGRGLYAFMQLISRYPDQLEQLLKHGSATVLAKVLGLNSSEAMEEEAEKEMEEKKIEEEKLEELLRSIADNNPACFVGLLSAYNFLGQRYGAIVRRVIRDYPKLLIRSAEDGIESSAERNSLAFMRLLRQHPDVFENADLKNSLSALAKYNPRAFVDLLLHESSYSPTILLEVAKEHPELLIRCSEMSDVESLAEGDPRNFAELFKGSAILRNAQLQEGLNWLAVRKPEAFVALLSRWSSFPQDVLVGVARKHPELLIRCSEDSSVESLAEKSIDALLAMLEGCPEILDSEQLQKGLEFLATQRPEVFIGQLGWISDQSHIAAMIMEVAKKHPELLMRSEEDGVSSLAERSPKRFVTVLIQCPGILNDQQLSKGWEFLATRRPRDFVNLLMKWIISITGIGLFGGDESDMVILGHQELLPVAYEAAKNHPELLIRRSEGSNVGSLAELDPEVFRYLANRPDILNSEQLREGLNFLAVHNPRAFIEVGFKCRRGPWDSESPTWWSPIVHEVARRHPELLIRHSSNSVESLVEREQEVFVNLVKESDILDDKWLQEGLDFLATYAPHTFFKLLKLWLRSPTKQLPIACEVAHKYEQFLIKYRKIRGWWSDDDIFREVFTDLSDAGGLEEGTPELYASLLAVNPEILSNEQLREGMNFLAVHHPKLFVEFMVAFSMPEEFDRRCEGMRIKPVSDRFEHLAQGIPALFGRYAEEQFQYEYACAYGDEDDDEDEDELKRPAFIEKEKVVAMMLEVALNNQEQLRKGLKILAAETLEGFVDFLRQWGKSEGIEPIITEIKKEYFESLAHDKRLQEELNILAANDPENFIILVSMMNEVMPEGSTLTRTVVYEVARRHPELLVACSEDWCENSCSLVQDYPDTFVSLIREPGIWNNRELRQGLESLATACSYLYQNAFVYLLAEWAVPGSVKRRRKSGTGVIPETSTPTTEWSPVICEVVRNHPEWLIACPRDSEIRTNLAENFPEAFVSLIRVPGILNDRELHKRLEFLATQHSKAFFELLQCWLKSPTEQLSIAYNVAQKYQKLLGNHNKDMGGRYDDLLQQLLAKKQK